ncbi:hypothetical protein [Absidia glauca]|uniref:Uncharacterized protein n=1 Tax=Absidia glauca TaxID=4829 RepID=A0A163ITF9_ABSGL|nr:hypothetical protein [Absidia glauca]
MVRKERKQNAADPDMYVPDRVKTTALLGKKPLYPCKDTDDCPDPDGCQGKRIIPSHFFLSSLSFSDMMQELFEEINGYLGDQGKPTVDPSTAGSPTTSILSPLNMSTKGEEEDYIENSKYPTPDSTMDPSDESLKSLSPLQTAMFVESDDDDSSFGTNRGDPRYSPTHPNDHTEQAVCACYKCKDDEPGRLGNNATATTATEPPSSKQRVLHKPKSTSSFGAVSSAKLAHIAGLVKQTLISTPRDILTAPPPTNQQHSLPGSTFDNLSETTPTSYNYDQRDMAVIRPHDDPLSPLGGTFSSHHASNTSERSDLPTFYGDNVASSINLEHRENQWNNSGGDYNLHDLSSSNTCIPGEQQQPLMVEGDTPQLPFLTSSHRLGEPHVIALRTKMARDVGSHDDRINAYNNAYSHCIMARTDMVPWIKKQYSKGPPDLVQNYTPRPKRSSKALFGLFKRHSRIDDPIPSTTLLSANSPSELANTSISSGKSSFLMESLHASSPQPTKSPQSLSTPSWNNDVELPSVHTIQPNQKEQQKSHRSLSPNPSEKKKPSTHSVEEPLSILKKSSSAASLVEPVSILKSPSPGYTTEPSLSKSRSQPSFLGEDRPVTSILKSRSPSPSMESRRATRSRSPIAHPPPPSSHPNSTSKRSHLLCPPPAPSSQPRQRSRSVSPSPQKSRSPSPMSRHSSPSAEHYNGSPRDSYPRQPPHRRSPSPSLVPPSRHHRSPSTPSQDQYLSPKRHSGTNHYRSNSNGSSRSHHTADYGDGSSRKTIHRARSNDYLDSVAPMAPINGSHFLLPLEQQHMAPRRLSHDYRSPPGPMLGSAGRRATDPPHRRRRSMAMDEEDYFSNRQQRPPSTQRQWPAPMGRPLSKRPSKSHLQETTALDDLCAFFQHMPRHILANYLQEAQGDFFLAKDICMEDIMANGI